jgi:surface protein
MKFYKSKGGYFYKEYKNGKKIRISKKDFYKQLKKSKQYNKNLKGGTSAAKVNKLVKQLTRLKKKINKLKQILKREQNLQNIENLNNNSNTKLLKREQILQNIENSNNNSNTKLYQAHKRLLLARMPNNPNINVRKIIATKLSSVNSIKERLLAEVRTYIDLIKATINYEDINHSNYTEIQNIQDFCDSVIQTSFPQITALEQSAFKDAVTAYFANESEATKTYGPIELWDVSNVYSMTFVFRNKPNFNADIGGWDVSQVCNMMSMFEGATDFNADIGGWDVSQVTDMMSMFEGATNFNADIGGWDVSRVQIMKLMFKNATAFNKDISKWNPINLDNTYYMFQGATSFNQDISIWPLILTKPQKFYMFQDCPLKEKYKCS